MDKSPAKILLTTPNTRSTRKRINGINHFTCDTTIPQNEKTTVLDVTDTDQTTLMEISEQFTDFDSTTMLIDFIPPVMNTPLPPPPPSRRKSLCKTPRRNSKLSEPFSPLALNSNVPHRERTPTVCFKRHH